MAEFRRMTDLERRCARALSPVAVRYPPASFPKRFGRDMSAKAASAEPVISEGQAEVMWRQAQRYRRQITDAAVRAEAERRAFPDRASAEHRAPSTEHSKDTLTPALSHGEREQDTRACARGS